MRGVKVSRAEQHIREQLAKGLSGKGRTLQPWSYDTNWRSGRRPADDNVMVDVSHNGLGFRDLTTYPRASEDGSAAIKLGSKEFGPTDELHGTVVAGSHAAFLSVQVAHSRFVIPILDNRRDCAYGRPTLYPGDTVAFRLMRGYVSQFDSHRCLLLAVDLRLLEPTKQDPAAMSPCVPAASCVEVRQGQRDTQAAINIMQGLVQRAALHHSQPRPLKVVRGPGVKVSIGGKVVEAAVDTMADVSLISTELFAKQLAAPLAAAGIHLQPCNVGVNGVNPGRAGAPWGVVWDVPIHFLLEDGSPAAPAELPPLKVDILVLSSVAGFLLGGPHITSHVSNIDNRHCELSITHTPLDVDAAAVDDYRVPFWLKEWYLDMEGRPIVSPTSV
jgi:hypothetical protein